MKADKWVSEWNSLLDTIEIQDGELRPVNKKIVADYKKNTLVSLPESYYGYSMTFGPGYLTNWNFSI